MRGKKVKKPLNLDPLYKLFETYLLTRSYESADSFTTQLARDYIAYLDSTPAHIPIYMREAVMEDLKHEAHELLVKKMYGCVNISDYKNIGKVIGIKDNMVQLFDIKINNSNPITSSQEE